MSVRLEWNGAKLLADLAVATKLAIDDVLADADQDASESHWWRNRTGNLESQIVTEDAKVVGPIVSGRFGTTERRGFYGLLLEYRTPFLRPAADRTFPTLAAKIRMRLG